ncbi:uncharacterized protein LOC117344542 [Pecten maximus]|uniref:uncharacterized protein LOC117344542 n=1 Tax=Pecten maximus TaxID=6579 RepID=UPI001458C40F|nr:uncharacterized protein LOC117344542 [Pecten maximus]XP_033763206.1 uncharacterized protein LOC117344542 [Pecten maximus]
MWGKVVQLVTLAWMGLEFTASYQMYPNTPAQVPYYGNEIYNQNPTQSQQLTPRLVQSQSFSANYNPKRTYSQRPGQRPANRQVGTHQSPTNTNVPKRKNRTKKTKASSRQSYYDTMMARRRVAAMHYRFRAQTCDPQMSLYCRCSRMDCQETELQVFPCGFMWSGRRCCKRWWVMKCMMSEMMSGSRHGVDRQDGQGQHQGQHQRQHQRQRGGRMSLQAAMMAPMLMEVFEM